MIKAVIINTDLNNLYSFLPMHLFIKKLLEDFIASLNELKSKKIFTKIPTAVNSEVLNITMLTKGTISNAILLRFNSMLRVFFS